MANLVEGYNAKNESFWGSPIIMQFIDFLGIYPSTKMAITPLLVDQIEKFQCLELSTAPKLSPGIFRCHMACVTCPQMWLKVSELCGLFTNKVADEIFQKSLFLLPGLVLNDFHNKIQCAIFFVRPIELRQCDRNTSELLLLQLKMRQ